VQVLLLTSSLTIIAGMLGGLRALATQLVRANDVADE
jgi:hypothetical protein